MGQVKGGAMAAILNAPAGSLEEVLKKLLKLDMLMLQITTLQRKLLLLVMKLLSLKRVNY